MNEFSVLRTTRSSRGKTPALATGVLHFARGKRLRSAHKSAELHASRKVSLRACFRYQRAWQLWTAESGVESVADTLRKEKRQLPKLAYGNASVHKASRENAMGLCRARGAMGLLSP